MIIDRLILFLFGKGPKAEQEAAALAAQNELGEGIKADVSKSPHQDMMKTRDEKKKTKKTARKKITKKKRVKTKRVKKKSIKKKTARKKTAKKKIIKKAVKRKITKKKRVKKKTAKKKTAKKKILKKTRKKQINKKTAKKSVKKSVQKSVHRDIHVVYRRKDNQWELRREGRERAWSLHNTQADAILYARQRARRDKVEMIIHAKGGSIRDSDRSR